MGDQPYKMQLAWANGQGSFEAVCILQMKPLAGLGALRGFMFRKWVLVVMLLKIAG